MTSRMDIDAYDTLGIGLDATEDDIKKAFKRQSLLHHPDKKGALSGRAKTEAEDKFNAVKLAKDILSEPERKKLYDTFGLDLGEEKPEDSIWTMGMEALFKPVWNFMCATALVRGTLWIISFTWPGRLLLLIGACTGLLCAFDVTIKDWCFRSPEVLSNLVLPIGVIDVLIVLSGVWTVLSDASGMFYLVSTIVGVPVLVENWKIGAGAGVASLVLARIAQGWWFWILGIEAFLAMVVLLSLFIAYFVVNLWTHEIQAQRGDALRTWRLNMRKGRKCFEDEIDGLKTQLQEAKAARR